MSIPIDHSEALRALLLVNKDVEDGKPLSTTGKLWKVEIDELGRLCPPRKSATTIASLGTAILAKSVNAKVGIGNIKAIAVACSRATAPLGGRL